MRTEHNQIPRRQGIVMKHDPVQHFVLQGLPDLLVVGGVHNVHQFTWIRPQVEELFSIVATGRHGVAEVLGSQGLIPGMRHELIAIRILA